jgi:hypothetical protein
MQTEATQHVYLESFTHPRKHIFLVSLAQGTSLRSVACEPTRIFFGDNLVSVIITTIGFSIFVNHNGDPLFYRITKQCCRRYFPIHKSFTFLGIDILLTIWEKMTKRNE